jgi:aspartyl-tRNA(Asn)/glutamyl-tRNA(Gln) amidotransferase subunit C
MPRRISVNVATTLTASRRERCGVCILNFAFCILHYDDLVPTTLTIADVERIAALAQLELTDEEKHLFTRQLADILHYAEQVQAVDTSGVPATAHVNSTLQAERDDEPRPSLPTEDAMANAPDAAPDAGLFRVPRVIGG